MRDIHQRIPVREDGKDVMTRELNILMEMMMLIFRLLMTIVSLLDTDKTDSSIIS
jgi:hypothetical protein